MKKRGIMICVLILAILAGCRQKEPEEIVKDPPSPPVEEMEPEKPAEELEELRIEISRGTQSADQLSEAIRELPDRFKGYLEEASDLKIGNVRVTVGASTAATAESLLKGTVDLAFLPAEDLLTYDEEAEILFADAGEDGQAGKSALICAAPTDYGRQLAQRAGSGKPLSWKEITRARWGILKAESSAEYKGVDLWLADGYEGNRVQDLAHVTKYETCEELFRAAAEGTIDAFVIPDDARADMAESWMLSAGQVDETGMQGFGRTESIWEEVPVLDTTERICSVVVAIAPDQEMISDSAFGEALDAALKRLQNEPTLMSVLGAEQFVSIEDTDLDSVRRSIQLEE